MKSLLIGFVIFFLYGCTSQKPWVKEGATRQDFKRDLAQCEYEAAGSVSSYSTGQTAYTAAGAMAQGAAEGAVKGLRRSELTSLCLKARGYIQAKIPETEGHGAPSNDLKKTWIEKMARMNGAEGDLLTKKTKSNGTKESYQVAAQDRTYNFDCDFHGPVEVGGTVPMIIVTGKSYSREPACWLK